MAPPATTPPARPARPAQRAPESPTSPRTPSADGNSPLPHPTSTSSGATDADTTAAGCGPASEEGARRRQADRQEALPGKRSHGLGCARRRDRPDPGYWQGGIHWSVTSRYGHYGTTDLATADIYISPGVPTSLLDSVVRHEYAHVVSVRAYGGQWQTTVSALNRAFGGSGMTGAERAADCMARAIGATWTYHTSCSSSAWRAMAASCSPDTGSEAGPPR